MVARIQTVLITSWQLPCSSAHGASVEQSCFISFTSTLLWLTFLKLEEGSFFFDRLQQFKDGRSIKLNTVIIYGCWHQSCVFWVLPVWDLKTGPETGPARDLLPSSEASKYSAYCRIFNTREFTLSCCAGKLQRLLSLMLIYPVGGDV